MTSNQEKSSVVEQHALERIPDNERKSWISVALIWAGAIISVPSLMVGGVLVSGLPLGKAILAGIIGYAIVVLFMTFQGMQGTDLGRPTVAAASSAFGESGSSFIISFVIGISVMGWFGVQTNITGSAFTSIMANWLGINIPIFLSSAIWGIIMLSTAIIGYKALAYLNYIAVPALLLIASYGTYSALNKFGIDGLASIQPDQPFSLLTGIGLTVGGFAVGGVIAGDYSRYAKNRTGSILSSVIGVLPLGVILLISGAIMSAIAGTADITQVISDLGFPALGLSVLILATWTTNAVNAYSGGLALTNMFKLSNEKRATATAVAGIIGTILAISGILNYFVPFLLILTAGISPIAGVMIGDYWVRRKGDPDKWKPQPGVNWIGIISWLGGFGVGYFLKVGISPINAILTSMVLFVILNLSINKSENVQVNEVE